MSIRIVIVEDDKLTRELIREYLAQDPDLEVVAETSNGAEAVGLAKQHRADIVLMDLALPGLGGLQATKGIKKVCPACDVIILTNYGFEDLKTRSQDMYGSSAYLLKEEIPRRLLGTIRSLTKARRKDSPSP